MAPPLLHVSAIALHQGRPEHTLFTNYWGNYPAKHEIGCTFSNIKKTEHDRMGCHVMPYNCHSFGSLKEVGSCPAGGVNLRLREPRRTMYRLTQTRLVASSNRRVEEGWDRMRSLTGLPVSPRVGAVDFATQHSLSKKVVSLLACSSMEGAREDGSAG